MSTLRHHRALVLCSALLACLLLPAGEQVGLLHAPRAHAQAAMSTELSPVADATVRSIVPYGNDGSTAILAVNSGSFAGHERALIRFDEAAMQAAVGANRLLSATVELEITGVASDWFGGRVGIHRMVMDWEEDGATWVCADDYYTGVIGDLFDNCLSSNEWGMSWYSWDPDPYDQTATDYAELYSTSADTMTFDVTSDVESILAGADNDGWALVGTDDLLSGVWVQFGSKESSSPAKLILTYEPPPVPPGPDPETIPVIVNATSDTFVSELFPDWAREGSTRLKANSDEALFTKHTLVAFDDAEIDSQLAALGVEASDELLSARLVMTVKDRWPLTNLGHTIDVHRMVAPWQADRATWHCGSDQNRANTWPDCATTAWDMLAPDPADRPYDVTPSDSLQAVTDYGGEMSFDVTDDVAQMLAGHVDNDGWLIQKPDQPWLGFISFFSVEGGIPPRLELVFQPACTATDPCDLGDGPCTEDDQCLGDLDCGFGIGALYGVTTERGVCWDADRCPVDPTALCGSPGDICGDICCTPTCGDPGDPDGCGGTCAACWPGADTDRDGLSDCDELADDSPWTNPVVFNGARARLGPTCNVAPGCGAITSAAQVAACDTRLDTTALSRGWDFATTGQDNCDPGFDFDTPWSVCRTEFAVRYDAHMYVEQPGYQCFAIDGLTGNQCGTLLAFGSDVPAYTSAGSICFLTPAGIFPVTWFYETRGEPTNAMSVLHCTGAAPCTPTQPVSQELLRPDSAVAPLLCGPGTSTCSPTCPCGTGGSCAEDTDCLQGFRCVDGACRDRDCDDLTSPAFWCGPGERCEPCGDCPDGPRCQAGTCEPGECGEKCGVDCGSCQPGCITDADCPAAHYCGIGEGPRIGLGPDVNVCLEVRYSSVNPSVNPCLDPANFGQPTDCGTCPTPGPKCVNRSCGPDGIGGSCGPTPAGMVCIEGIPVPEGPPETLAAAQVGTLPGGVSVGSQGQAQYRIPLELPPGRGGMTPGLALSYDSNRGYGRVGQGWAVEGLSVITRCNKTIVTDGHAEAPKALSDDALCLDGQRLIQVDDGDGDDLTVGFRFERDSFAEITGHYFTTPPFAEWASFDAIEVAYPGGNVAVYGATEDSRLMGEWPGESETGGGFTRRPFVQRWAISRVEDRNGNQIRYSYDELDNRLSGGQLAREHRPRTIAYSQHASHGLGVPPELSAPQFVVSFVYEDRDDPRTSLSQGSAIATFSRLQEIRVDGLRTHRRYQLLYGDATAEGPPLTRLRSVQDCLYPSYGATTPHSCKPVTAFEYAQPTLLPGSATVGGSGPLAGSARGEVVHTALDANGDGRSDLLVTRRVNPDDDEDPERETVLWLSETHPDSTELQLSAQPLGPASWVPSIGSTLHVLDADGDGDDEILLLDSYPVDTDNGAFSWHTRCAAAPGHARGTLIYFEEVEGSSVPTALQYRLCLPAASSSFVIDIDGDMQKEVLQCTKQDFSSDPPQWEYHELLDLAPPVQVVGAGTGLDGLESCPWPQRPIQTFQQPGQSFSALTYSGIGSWGSVSVSHVLDVDRDGTEELMFLEHADAPLNTFDPDNPVVPIGIGPNPMRHWRYRLVQFDLASLSAPDPADRNAKAQIAQTQIPLEARPIDLNGDGLQDFYRIHNCRRFAESAFYDRNGQACADYLDQPVFEAWLNRGNQDGVVSTGFWKLASTTLPAQDWTIAYLARTTSASDNTGFSTRLTDLGYSVPLGEVPAAFTEKLEDEVSMAMQLSRPIDANGDGLDDLLIPLPDDGWVVFYSTGEGLDTVGRDRLNVPWDPTPPIGDEGTVLNDFTNYHALHRVYDHIRSFGQEAPTIFDASGDGRPDIIFRTVDASQLVDGVDPTQQWASALLTGISTPLLTRATNGLEQHTELEYGYLADRREDTQIYAPTDPLAPTPVPCESRQRCERQPRGVAVATVTHGRRDNTSGTEVFVPKTISEYHYYDHRVDTLGRGSLGFMARRQRSQPAIDPEPEKYRVESIVQYNPQLDVSTGLYIGRGRPAVAFSQTQAGPGLATVVKRDLSIFTYDTLHPADGTLHVYTRERRDLHFEGNELIRDWMTQTTVDIYGNVTAIQQGLWDEYNGTFDFEAPEGTRLTGFIYKHSADPAYDVIGKRNLPEYAVEGFEQTGTGSPFGGTVSHFRAQRFDYDAVGNLQLIERAPDGFGDQGDDLRRTEQRTYDAYGNLAERTLEAANAPTRNEFFAYDSRFLHLIEHVDATGYPASIGIDPRFGTLESHIDINNIETTVLRDGFGRVIERQSPVQTETTSYASGTSDLPLQIDILVTGGQHTTAHFDPFGRVRETVDRGVRGVELVSTREYDDLDRVLKVTRPHVVGEVAEILTQSVIEYRDHERRTKRSWWQDTGASRVQRTVEQCSRGLSVCETDERGFTSCAETDRVGNVIASYDPAPVAEPWNATPATQPDCRDVLTNLASATPATTHLYSEWLVRTTDAAGNHTTIEYDDYGRRVRLADPDTGISAWAHDGFDFMRAEIDANGHQAEFEYDALGRMQLRRDIDFPEAGTNSETRWYWDGVDPIDGSRGADELVGSLTMTESPEGHRKRYAYDGDGRLTGITQTMGDTAEVFEVELLDYLNARPQVIRYPANGVLADLEVRHEYDAHGNLLSLTRVSDGEVLWVLEETDPFGAIAQELAGNDVRSTYSFDNRSLLTSVRDERLDSSGAAVELLRERAYGYDVIGNLTSRTGNGSQAEAFHHDHLNRLVDSLVYSPTVTSYPNVYDSVGDHSLGNFESRAGVGSYQYLAPNPPDEPGMPLPANKPHVASRAGGVAYLYDQVGNMVERAPDASSTVECFGYTPFNKPRAMWRGDCSLDPADLSLGTDVVSFAYDADHQRIRKEANAERPADREVTTYFEGLYELRQTPAGTEHVYYLNADHRRVGQLVLPPGGGAYEASYHHVDHLGSTELTTDDSGAADEWFSYEAFGQARDPNDWDLWIDGSGGIGEVNTGFTSHERVDDYGLINMGGRQYDPLLARFTSADPFVSQPFFSQSYNRYAYVWNSPLSLVDPSGFNPQSHEQDIEPARADGTEIKPDFQDVDPETGETIDGYIVTATRDPSAGGDPASAGPNAQNGGGIQADGPAGGGIDRGGISGGTGPGGPGGDGGTRGGTSIGFDNAIRTIRGSGAIGDNSEVRGGRTRASPSMVELARGFEHGVNRTVAGIAVEATIQVVGGQLVRLAIGAGSAVLRPIQGALAHLSGRVSGWFASRALPALRQQYVDAVKNLAVQSWRLRALGKSPEQVARALHAARRQLGVKFKDLTPPDLLQKIYQRNLQKYGDKLGPSIEWLRARGKTWEQIIETAAKPGGKDLGF